MEADNACHRVAAGQQGLMTRAQALATGMTTSSIDRRLASGAWTIEMPGVYRVGGASSTWIARATAAALWGGPVSALSHSTAATLWGLEGFPPGPIELTTERALRSRERVRVHRVQALTRAELDKRAGLQVTSPARTLLDLAGTAPENVEDALDQALVTSLISLPKLRWFLQTHAGRGRRGTAVLKALLAARPSGYAPPHSPLERRVWDLLLAAGLPVPVRQFEVFDGPRFVARVDLAYPAARLAIEADGYRWHAGRTAWSRDMVRRNRLTALGWHVLHVTEADLSKPADVQDQVARLLNLARRTSLSEVTGAKFEAVSRKR